jgi:DNA-binding transcriptional LysR family regulator
MSNTTAWTTSVWDARSITVDLRHFRSFVAVAEEGKIGRAATHLYITQPALSLQIQQLEREIREPLLLRVPHGVELTEAGRELLDKARVAIAAASGLRVAVPSEKRSRDPPGPSPSEPDSAARWRSGSA